MVLFVHARSAVCNPRLVTSPDVWRLTAGQLLSIFTPKQSARRDGGFLGQGLSGFRLDDGIFGITIGSGCCFPTSGAKERLHARADSTQITTGVGTTGGVAGLWP